MIRLLLARPRDRVALAAIAATAIASSMLEATVLVIITLSGFRLAGTGSDPVNLPFGIPLDELATGRLIAVGAGLLVIRLVVATANIYGSARLSESILYRWRTRVVAAYLGTSWLRQRSEEDGRLHTVAQSYVASLSGVVQQVSTALTSMASFLTFVVAAFALNVFAAIGLLVFGGLLMFLLRPLTVKVRQLAGNEQTEGREYARLLGELTAVAGEVKVFGREREVSDRLDIRLRAVATARRRQVLARGVSPQIFQAAGLSTVLVGLAIATQLDVADATLVGALVLLLIRSLNYGQTFQATFQAVAGSRPFVEGVLEAVHEYESATFASGTTGLDRVGRLELRGVTLGYGDSIVLDDVLLDVSPGEAIGLIGPSGAGKSTLGAALLDLIRPLAGDYLVSGMSAAEIDRSAWTSRVAFVPQDPNLLDGTVRDNITFFRSCGEAEIDEAVVAAHLLTEVSQWPLGLEHTVGPRGSRLSGGQKQRVSIARALLGKPDLLVLDEPTSALDNDAEDAITDVLRDLRGRCTLVIIAHRLSTLEFCDRVFVVSQGRVAEIGTGLDVQNRADIRRLVEDALAEDTIR